MCPHPNLSPSSLPFPHPPGPTAAAGRRDGTEQFGDGTGAEKAEEGTGIIVEDQWRRHLYISEMYMENYWHKNYDVLIQEHNQLHENSIQHMRNEVTKELDELWRLIQ